MNGYMKNSLGHLVPESMVSELDRTRDSLVREIAAGAARASEGLARYKLTTMGDVTAFCELSAERFGVKFGGKKGNITLTSYDGRTRVQVAISEYLEFDERLQVAKELIDLCIERWSDGANDYIRVLVQHAFRTNKTGQISTAHVLALRQLVIDDPQWQQAMQAIMDSMQITGSRSYVRVYRRDDNDRWRQVPLDVAAVG